MPIPDPSTLGVISAVKGVCRCASVTDVKLGINRLKLLVVCVALLSTAG